MKKKILILGGSGFIGQNLIKKILKLKEFQITSACRSNSYYNIFKKKITHIKLDLKNKEDLDKIKSKKFDYVINLSGNIDHKNKEETNQIHNISSKNIFRIFSKKKIKLFIHVGSSLEYGNHESPQGEGLRCKPISEYGKSKLAATSYIKKLATKKKINFIILRLYQIYGPFQKFDRLIPFVIKNCLNDKRFNCTSGSQFRDFLYVDDLTNLFIKILKKKRIKSGIFNVGSGEGVKVRSVIEIINKKIKKGKPLFGKIKMREDEAEKLFPNIKKIKKYFNWKPKINIFEGLKKTIIFYKKKR